MCSHTHPPPLPHTCTPHSLTPTNTTTHSNHIPKQQILLYHGDVLAQRGDLAGAMRRFQEAAHADPACPLPFVNAARAYLSVSVSAHVRVFVLGFCLVLSAYTQIDRPRKPDQPQCKQVRDYPQAERHLAQALALDPACGASHLDMGQLHVQRGETGKAEAALARALAQVGGCECVCILTWTRG